MVRQAAKHYFVELVPPFTNQNFGEKQPKVAVFEGTNVATFDCFWPLLPTRSNFYGSKWLVQVSRI